MESTITLKEIDFSIIESTRTMNQEIKEMKLKKSHLSKPILEDTDKLPILYDIFKQTIYQFPDYTGKNKTKERYMFIFISLYLYSPSALAGEKTKNGICEAIAETMGITSKTSISHDLKKIGGWVKFYTDYRDALICVYPIMMSEFERQQR